jgi:hypothetical protein
VPTLAPAGPTAHVPPALPRPYARPPRADALRPDPATVALVRDQVRALLLATPSFAALPSERRRRLAKDLVKISAYAAECVRDDWYQSERRLEQRPLVVRSQQLPMAEAQADQRPGADFVPGAAQKIGQVTRQTLDAIAFPTFVAELIRGTFDAITQASVKQMEAYGRLLGNVGRSVDDFMNQNISDNQARDWLVESYPNHLRVEKRGGSPAPQRPGAKQSRVPQRGGAAPVEAVLMPVEDAREKPLPNWRGDLGVSGTPSLDESWLEEKLVPAARRKMAQTRLSMLSTMVLMGMNRITVTGGKLRATMAFHIDTSDFAREERATDLDIRHAAQGAANMGWWSASASVSFAYVSSTRNLSESEMNVAADLTGEVEIHFKSDPFPLERMAGAAQLGTIVSHTAVPEANAPISSTGSPITWGGEVKPAAVPARNRKEPELRKLGELPAVREPVKPTPQPENDLKPKDEVEAAKKPAAEKPPEEKLPGEKPAAEAPVEGGTT